MKIALYYLITIITLTYYGIEVCPYLETLAPITLAINLSIFFIPAYFIRFIFIKYWVNSAAPLLQPKRQLKVELSSFIVVGLAISIFNLIVYSFPLGSGLKVLLGTATFGFFASFDVVLEKERDIINKTNQLSAQLFSQNNFFSLPKKFTLVAITTGIFTTLIILLLIIKDFQWLAENVNTYGIANARNSVIYEILFVFIVFFILGLKLILSYSKNLKFYFTNQTQVLEDIAQGNLEQYVPVVTNDEFGQIASHTNQMIDGLKEKNKIKNMFGKVLSPTIAQKILNQNENQDSLDSEKQSLVILFSDIRGFTELTEKNDAEFLVKELNKYFSKMVAIINHNHGVVDKFIGDGILAVYGLDSEENAVQDAVQSAIEMQKTLNASQFNIPIEIGIGIHYGEVIAGIIGSPDRHEYTFIGDTVNTASRLEGKTKELGASILLSNHVYKKLNSNLLNYPWNEYGEIALKGKSIEIQTYGIDKNYFKN